MIRVHNRHQNRLSDSNHLLPFFAHRNMTPKLWLGYLEPIYGDHTGPRKSEAVNTLVSTFPIFLWLNVLIVYDMKYPL